MGPPTLRYQGLDGAIHSPVARKCGWPLVPFDNSKLPILSISYPSRFPRLPKTLQSFLNSRESWPSGALRPPDEFGGTDQGFGVSLEHEDGDTRGGRGRCWEMSAYTSAARHAAKCAESGRTRNVA